MKRSSTILLFVSAIIVLLLGLHLFAQTSAQPKRAAVAKPATTAKAKAEFEVVATKRVKSAQSTYNSVSFDRADETGLVVIFKRSSATDQITIHTNDYVLVFDSDSDIPRRPCLGLSYGMKSADEDITWANIGGGASRGWIKPGQEYFALLFPAPKNVKTYSVYRAAPLTAQFAVKD